MRQFYIRKSQRTAIGNISVGSICVAGRICANCMIFAFTLLHNAEFVPAKKNLILIGTARSYLAVILPNMDPGTGGECG